MELLIKLSDNSYLQQIAISKISIISKIELHFINHHDNYHNDCCFINNENLSYQNTPVLKLPIILSYLEAERLGQLILKNAATETKILRFTIPSNFNYYQPSDFIILNYANNHYQIRIISIKLALLTAEITGIIDEVASYYLPRISKPTWQLD